MIRGEEFEKECPEYYEKIVEKLRIENEFEDALR